MTELFTLSLMLILVALREEANLSLYLGSSSFSYDSYLMMIGECQSVDRRTSKLRPWLFELAFSSS